jgi:hypothetical protein
MGNSNAKADDKVNNKLSQFVDPVVGVQNGQPANIGWNRTFARLRTAAKYVLIGSIALTVAISLFTPYKFFPKQPNFNDLQTHRLIQEVKDYQSPLLRHDAGPQFI